MVCLTTAWQTLASQPLFSTHKPTKQRWQTILANNPLGGIDTLIQGPRREFVTIVSNKLVADQNTRLAILAIASLNKQVKGLEADVSVLSDALQSSLKVSSERVDIIGKLQEDVSDWKTLAHSNKSWAIIGKVATFTVGIGVVATVVVVVKREFDDR